MKAAVITTYPYPMGFNHGVLNFCKLAPQYGVDPVLVAQTLAPDTENPMVIEARRLGVHVETLHEKHRYDPGIFPGLVNIIKRNRVQLIDVQTYKPLALGIYARIFGKHLPMVSWVHGFTQEDMKVRIYGSIERLLHRFSTKVICVSDPFSRLIARSGVPAGKIEIVPNAISEDEFDEDPNPDEIRTELGLSEKNKIVGAIGRLSPEKGHAFLIEAWLEIAGAFPDARLVIVGDGPCRGDLERRVKESGLRDSVFFTGFRKDGRRFFSIFDIMVLPSLDEGLPYVLLEAMIQKTPVAASDVGEVSRVLNNGELGLLSRPGDVGDLTSNIIDILSNPDKWRNVSERARDFAIENYSHEARTKQIADIYKSCFGSP